MDLLSNAEHWRYPDRCERCTVALQLDVEASEPELVIATSPDAVVAFYTCDRSHQWTCSWARIGIGHLAA